VTQEHTIPHSVAMIIVLEGCDRSDGTHSDRRKALKTISQTRMGRAGMSGTGMSEMGVGRIRTGGARTGGTTRNAGQHSLLPALLMIILAIILGHASTQASDVLRRQQPMVRHELLATQEPTTPGQQPGESGQPPAAQGESATAQQQPAQPPSEQVVAPQEPSPTQQAIEVLRAEIALDSLNPRFHYELANALHDAGSKEEALYEYDKALSLKPEFKETLVNRGAVLNEMGRVTDAIASFEKALTLAPRDTKALVNLGNSFYAIQQYGEALKRYKLAVGADTTFGEGYYYIGIAFADAGIYREAVREWEKILQVAPNSDAAKNAQENIDTLKNFLTSETQPGNRPKME